MHPKGTNSMSTRRTKYTAAFHCSFILCIKWQSMEKSRAELLEGQVKGRQWDWLSHTYLSTKGRQWGWLGHTYLSTKGRQWDWLGHTYLSTNWRQWGWLGHTYLSTKGRQWGWLGHIHLDKSRGDSGAGFDIPT